jgi:hypothetical protein
MSDSSQIAGEEMKEITINATKLTSEILRQLEILMEDYNNFQVFACLTEDAQKYMETDPVPMPWDAWFDIEGENLVINGGVGPHGFGIVVVTLPLAKAKDYCVIVQALSDRTIPDELLALANQPVNAEHAFIVVREIRV